MNSANPDIITDVNSSTLKYLWTEHRFQYLFYTILMVVTAFGLLLLSGDIRAIVIPGFIYAAWYAKNRMLVQDQFMQQFASLNRLDFSAPGAPTDTDGRPFGIGHDPEYRDLIRGDFKVAPFELFLYKYLTGYGRNQSVTRMTVLTARLDHPVPSLFVSAVGRPNAGFAKFMDLGLPAPRLRQGLKIGNDFDKYFTVEPAPGLEIEALQILEPDLMQFLIDQPLHFDFELKDSTLYIYSYGYVHQKAVLDGLFVYAEALVYRIQREAKEANFADASSVVHKYYTNDLTPISYGWTLLLNSLTIFLLPIGPFFIFIAFFLPQTDARNAFALTGFGISALGLLLWRIRREP